jgi:hypothetical protein
MLIAWGVFFGFFWQRYAMKRVPKGMFYSDCCAFVFLFLIITRKSEYR